VVQVSSQWQQRLHSIQTAMPETKTALFKAVVHWKRSPQWSIGLAIGVLLLWNWKLVFASGIGVLAAIATYFAQQGEWRFFWISWNQLWQQTNRQLTFALISGSLATLSSYVAIAAWLETESHWLTTAILLQGFGILAVLLLLVRQMAQPQAEHLAAPDRLLDQLTDSDPLKRLIAVRQITHQVMEPQSTTQRSPHPQTTSPIMRSHVVEYFRLMLDRETEPVVCQALLDGLRLLSRDRQPHQRQLAPGQQPRLSIHSNRSAIRVQRRAIADPIQTID
jgi:hypothetical protein